MWVMTRVAPTCANCSRKKLPAGPINLTHQSLQTLTAPRATYWLVKAGTSSLSQNKNIFFASLNSWRNKPLLPLLPPVPASQNRKFPDKNTPGSFSGHSASGTYINHFRTPVRFSLSTSALSAISCSRSTKPNKTERKGRGV